MRSKCIVFCACLSAIIVLLGVSGAAWAGVESQPSSALRKARIDPSFVFPDNSTLYVVFRFGAWTRLAYNASKLTAPVAIYFYSSTGLPAVVSTNYNTTWRGSWGLAANLSKLDLEKPLEIYVKYRGKLYRFVFKPVKAIKEEEQKKGKEITLTVREFREWLDREAQYATLLALLAFGLAVVVKRKTLLISTFNALNVSLLLFLSMLIYYAATRLGHSGWLSASFMLSYVLSYRVLPVGRKVLLIKILPGLRRLLMETAVLYRTMDGRLAYARQSIGEAFRRLRGDHIIVHDVASNRFGDLSEDKLWHVEEIDTLAKYEALIVLDARITREKEKGGEEK